MTTKRLDVQKRYLEIYDLHLRKTPHHEIAKFMDCSTSTVGRAVKYYREHVAHPSQSEDFQDAVDSIKRNLRSLYSRLEEVQKGVEETTTKEKKGETETVTTLKKPISAEVALYREIREYEKLLSTLQGLMDMAKKDKTEDKEIVIEFAK